MQTKQNMSIKIRKIKSQIDQAEGKIRQLVEETTEQSNKLTEVEQTVGSISQKVSDFENLTNNVEGIKTIALGNCAEGALYELHIYGNTTNK